MYFMHCTHFIILTWFLQTQSRKLHYYNSTRTDKTRIIHGPDK